VKWEKNFILTDNLTLIAVGFSGYFFLKQQHIQTGLDLFSCVGLNINPLSMITGVGSAGDLSKLARLGLKTKGYYVISTWWL
jgi:Na+/H+-dicarboxylate symporter